MGFCPMKIVFDGILLLVSGAFPALVFSVMPCSLPSSCKLTQTKEDRAEGFQVSYCTEFRGERAVVPIRFVILRLFSVYVSVTVDVGVLRSPIGRQSSV